MYSRAQGYYSLDISSLAIPTRHFPHIKTLLWHGGLWRVEKTGENPEMSSAQCPRTLQKILTARISSSGQASIISYNKMLVIIFNLSYFSLSYDTNVYNNGLKKELMGIMPTANTINTLADTSTLIINKMDMIKTINQQTTWYNVIKASFIESDLSLSLFPMVFPSLLIFCDVSLVYWKSLK